MVNNNNIRGRVFLPVATLRARNPFRALWGWIKNRPTTFAISSLIALGGGTLLYFIVWMATPRDINVAVHDISWMHITHLRERETRHAEGWYHQTTKGFYKEPVMNQSCSRRFHYNETYVCGSYQVSCGSNCSTTVFIYCDRDVYDDWCSYDYYEWPVINTQQKMGWTHDVEWGEFTPGPTQRVQKISNYEVNFATEDDSFQYKPSRLDDYRRFTPGDKWRLTVGRIRRHNIEHMEKL